MRTQLLGAVVDHLTSVLTTATTLEPHVLAFIAWIDPLEGSGDTDLAALAAEAAAQHGAAFTYRHAAVLGFASVVTTGQSPISSRLIEAMAWLADRRWFVPGRPPTLEADGIALLGIAIGVTGIPAGEVRKRLDDWLDRLLHGAAQLCSGGDWEGGLIDAALAVVSRSRSSETDSRVRMPALAAVLAGRGLLKLDDNGELAAVRSVFELALDVELGSAQAAVYLSALRWLLRTAPRVLRGKATPVQVVELLNEVSHALRLWTWEEKPRKRQANGQATKWDIVNEYHVQNLLWTILAPVFPDLENEEYLRSLGHKHPRADLVIPSLKLIVEAKFVYKGQDSEFASIIEQVAADAGLYLADPTVFNALIVFVWDNSARVESHGELRRGLLKIPNVMGAIVTPRPGKMKRQAEAY